MSRRRSPETWRRPVLAAVFYAALMPLTRPAQADPIIADLSNHQIAITGGFSGASVMLFGAIDTPGDIIAVVRGPERDMTVWRKRKVVGVWVNAESVTFTNVPSFYAVAASRPLEDLLASGAASLYRIGVNNLRLESRELMGPERSKRFTDALIEQQERAGVIIGDVGKVNFLAERLFRTTITFPSNVPVGTYLVEVFLARDHDVVGAQTTPLRVDKVGIDARVSDFATREAALYGAIAVLTAVVAGWLASLPFRGV